MLSRYKNGVKVGNTGRKAHMRNNWATPRIPLHTIYKTFHVTQERFASPLNFDMDGKWYWSAHEHDQLFGARHDAYSSTFSGASVYMNPEYEQTNLLKAMKWTVWSTVTPPLEPPKSLWAG
eukprot:5572356-Pyramimonas_sp.AAC.1